MSDTPLATTSNDQDGAAGSVEEREVVEIPDRRPYRGGQKLRKMLPTGLVRSTGLVTHQGTLRREWPALQLFAGQADISDRAKTIRYTNRHTRIQREVELEEGKILHSRLSLTSALLREIDKRWIEPEDGALSKDWDPELKKAYFRDRHSLDRLVKNGYVENLGPAVNGETDLHTDLNGRLWHVSEELLDLPDAPPLPYSVRSTGPEPEVNWEAPYIDPLEEQSRIKAHRDTLHKKFIAGWKAEEKDGNWTHTAKTNARRSHQWTATHGTDRPQYVSPGRRRPEEVKEDDPHDQRDVYLQNIPLDIDTEDKEKAGDFTLRILRRVRSMLREDSLEDELERIVVSYSGNVSCHIRLPAGLLGNRIFRSREAAREALSTFADRLCDGDEELREAIDDSVFDPRSVLRMIGSTYEEDTDPPDNSSWRPWLVNKLSLRPQIRDRGHAEQVANTVLDFLRRRHLDIRDVDLQFEDERAVTVSNAPDRTPNTNRVTACTAREFLEHGPEPLWAQSECGVHQPFDIPDPTQASYSPTLDALLPTRPGERKKPVTPNVAKQPENGVVERARNVEVEGEKWGRDVDRPEFVGRNWAAFILSLYAHTCRDRPWPWIRDWNGGMTEPLPRPELRTTFASAERYV